MKEGRGEKKRERKEVTVKEKRKRKPEITFFFFFVSLSTPLSLSPSLSLFEKDSTSSFHDDCIQGERSVCFASSLYLSRTIPKREKKKERKKGDSFSPAVFSSSRVPPSLRKEKPR